MLFRLWASGASVLWRVLDQILMTCKSWASSLFGVTHFLCSRINIPMMHNYCSLHGWQANQRWRYLSHRRTVKSLRSKIGYNTLRPAGTTICHSHSTISCNFHANKLTMVEQIKCIPINGKAQHNEPSANLHISLYIIHQARMQIMPHFHHYCIVSQTGNGGWSYVVLAYIHQESSIKFNISNCRIEKPALSPHIPPFLLIHFKYAHFVYGLTNRQKRTGLYRILKQSVDSGPHFINYHNWPE